MPGRESQVETLNSTKSRRQSGKTYIFKFLSLESISKSHLLIVPVDSGLMIAKAMVGKHSNQHSRSGL